MEGKADCIQITSIAPNLSSTAPLLASLKDLEFDHHLNGGGENGVLHKSSYPSIPGALDLSAKVLLAPTSG